MSRKAGPFVLMYTGHLATTEPQFPDMKAAQAALSAALKGELQDARRRWPKARIHRYKTSGEVLAGQDRRCALWMGISIVPA